MRDGGTASRRVRGQATLRQRPAPVRRRAKAAGQAAAHQRRVPSPCTTPGFPLVSAFYR